MSNAANRSGLSRQRAQPRLTAVESAAAGRLTVAFVARVTARRQRSVDCKPEALKPTNSDVTCPLNVSQV